MDGSSWDSEYRLAAELVGHDRDVRGVLGTQSGKVVTTSRDQTGRIWSDEGPEGWRSGVVLTGHTHFVSPVVEDAAGNIVTGGYDKMVVVWNAASGEAEQMLLGHEEAVVCLGVAADGRILSGSWDQTVRVWERGEAAAVLRGHTAAVWGVVGAPNGDVWSSSADKTVKIWRGGHCIKTLTESADCVRGMHVVPGAGVLVASNDQIVRLYSFDGELVRQLHGHSSYVYAVTSVGPDHETFISGGEDCTVRIWRGSECVQTIDFPSTVWDVSVLPNGDFVAGCADSIARVFTCDPRRAASDAAVQVFQKRIADAQEKAAEAAMKQMDLSQYPGYEALAVDGKREGQTLVVRKPDGKGAEAYNWTDGKWVLVGDVVGPAGGGAGGGGNLSGKDYEFPVDLDGRKYRIAMNRGDNVYETASQFVADNDLSAEFLDQIVDFLHQNTAAADAAAGGGAAGNQANRPKPAQELSYNPSPWANDPEPQVKQQPRAFPRANYVLFDVPGNLAGLTKKAVEFGAKESDVTSLVSKAKSGAVLSDGEWSALQAMLQFPNDKLFPALDLLRLLALNEKAAARVDDVTWKRMMDALAIPGFPCSMLALKFFVNCVRWEALKGRLSAQLSALLDAAAGLAHEQNAKTLNALVLLMQNVSVLLLGQARDEARTQAISICSELLDSVTAHADLLGVVSALGTLVWKDESARSLLLDLDIVEKLETLAKKHAAISTACNELVSYARAMKVDK